MYQWGLGLIITGLLCAQPSATTNDVADLLLWRSVREATDPALVASYLRSFPQGFFRVAATERLIALARNDQPRPPSPVTIPRFAVHHVHTWESPVFWRPHHYERGHDVRRPAPHDVPSRTACNPRHRARARAHCPAVSASSRWTASARSSSSTLRHRRSPTLQRAWYGSTR